MSRLGCPGVTTRGRSSPSAATDPSLWCDVTKDPYLGCARA